MAARVILADSIIKGLNYGKPRRKLCEFMHQLIVSIPWTRRAR
jgi:hypothetical protein